MKARNLEKLHDSGPLTLWQTSFDGLSLDVLCLGDAILGASINGQPTKVVFTGYGSWNVFPYDASGVVGIASEMFKLQKGPTALFALQLKNSLKPTQE